MINVDNVKALLTDLRSGEFNQTTSRLGRRENGKDSFCCEGVGSLRACKALGLSIHAPQFDDFGTWIFDGVGGLASIRVADYYGFETYTGKDDGWIVRIPTSDTWNDDVSWVKLALSELNDSLVPFPNIADVIEWYYLNGGHEAYQMWVSAQANRFA
jgi:hypothetical protein